MKYIFFRDTDITLAQYNSLRTNETPLTISTMEHGWIMLRADDDAFEPPFPHVDVEHVYTTFIKMPAGPKIQLRIETEGMPAALKESLEPTKGRDPAYIGAILAAKHTAREVGYHAYLNDRKSKGGMQVSNNPYTDPTLAREWEAGREKARTEFDPAGPEELTEAETWENAFQAGVRASKAGLPIEKNAFLGKTPAWGAWRDGWLSVQDTKAPEEKSGEDPVNSSEWIEGYNAFLFDRASPGKTSINPYSREKEHQKARDWDSGYEKSLSDFDESITAED